MSSKTTNLGLTKPAEDEFYDVGVQNENMDKIDSEIGGLENPSYEEADKTAKLVSGEKYTIVFGKIAKAVSTLISHISAKATSSVMGHVKLSDSTSSTSAASAGVAATPKAVKTAYDLANENSRKIGTTDISGIGDGTMTGAVDALNQSKLSDISGSMISASSSVTVGAGETADFTVTFPVPSGCRAIPFFAYVKSTGWAGLITQGTIVSVTKAEATFTLYNASTSQRTVKPQCVALFYKK